MNRPRNFRVFFLLGVLLIVGVVQLLREHRPSFLRPGLRLCAYVSVGDGTVTVGEFCINCAAISCLAGDN